MAEDEPEMESVFVTEIKQPQAGVCVNVNASDDTIAGVIDDAFKLYDRFNTGFDAGQTESTMQGRRVAVILFETLTG